MNKLGIDVSEASWSALEENFPWEGVSEYGFDVDTKQKKKDYLIAERINILNRLSDSHKSGMMIMVT